MLQAMRPTWGITTAHILPVTKSPCLSHEHVHILHLTILTIKQLTPTTFLSKV